MGLRIGVTMAHFQSLGTYPCLNIKFSISRRLSRLFTFRFFSILLWILSRPIALSWRCSRLRDSSCMLNSVSRGSPSEFRRRSPISSSCSGFSAVGALLRGKNWPKKILAFSKGSIMGTQLWLLSGVLVVSLCPFIMA